MSETGITTSSSVKSISGHRDEAREEVVEALVAFVDAAFHPARDHGVTRLDRLMRGMDPHNRPIASRFEGQRVERDVTGCALELEGLRHPRRGRLAVEDAVEGVRVAIRVAVRVAPSTAVASVVLVDRHLVVLRAEPLLDQLGICVSSKEKVDGSVELALEVDERQARLGIDLRRSHDGSSWLWIDSWVQSAGSAGSVAGGPTWSAASRTSSRS